MKKIQDSSVSLSRPIVTSAGSEGWFKGADASAATKVTADWLNDIQGTFLDLFSRASITPVAGSSGDRQLYDAIQFFIQPIANAAFPAGTRLVFAQSSAPVGWTQIVDDTATNRMLRVVNSTGGGIAGSDSPILNDKVPLHNHQFTGNVGTTTPSVIQHTHTFTATSTIESAHHTHSYTDRYYPESFQAGTGPYIAIPQGGGSNASDNDNVFARYIIDNTGIEIGDHTHNVTGTTGSASDSPHTITPSGTIANNAGGSNWTPRYIDIIICSKN